MPRMSVRAYGSIKRTLVKYGSLFLKEWLITYHASAKVKIFKTCGIKCSAYHVNKERFETKFLGGPYYP